MPARGAKFVMRRRRRRPEPAIIFASAKYKSAGLQFGLGQSHIVKKPSPAIQMPTQTYQPAPNETLGQFVDLLFQRLFFNQEDMPLVLSTFENDVAADALIEVNGTNFSPAAFLEVIKEFHTTSLATLTAIEDLVVVPLDSAARTGVVAQISKFTVTNKADAEVKEQVSVTVVKVEEKDGRRVMTSLVEAQT
ncbi:hypothetical protein B0H19DRAFT_1265882 [Mycena capillaripes]|nr:hypothetical protein B0H19DRAFT_1265882 [Mycena capillaripes]